MRDTTLVKLRDVVSRVAVRNSVGNSNVLTISATHGLVNQERYFNRRVASSDLSQYCLLQKGDFAYNKSYSTGWPVGVVRRLRHYEDGVVSPLYICFRPDVSRVDPSYLQHYFNSGALNDHILGIAKEGVRNHGLLNVGVEDFFDLPLKLPPLSEQQRIAEIFDAFDMQIQRLHSEALKLGSLSDSVLDAKLRVALQVLEGTEVSNMAERIGETAGCFRFVVLGSLLASIDAGHSPDLEDKPAGAGQWGVLKVSAVGREGFRPLENKRVEAGDLVDASLEVRQGDLLMTRANTPELVGLSCVVGEVRPGLMLSDKTLRLNLACREDDPHFLNALLRQSALRRQIEVAATGTSSSMKNISQESIRRLVVPWVDPSMQATILAPVVAIREKRNRLKCEVVKLKSARKALMNDLLAGQVRISTAS
jgi:type I restriction enzyme S subunit